MVWICLFHIWTPFNTLHTNIAVEFFFIVAGAFIYRTSNLRQEAPGRYAIRRFNRLFPVYFIGITLTYIIVIFDMLRDSSNPDWIDLLMNYIPDSLMAQETGAFYFPPVHTATWFVGVLFIGSILVYSFLAYNQKLALYIVFPCAAIGIYSLIFSHGLNIVDLFATEAPLKGVVFLPLARGFADMCLGVLIAVVNEQYLSKGKSILLDILSIISLLIITLYGFFIKSFYEAQMILLFSILIAALLNPGALFNKLFKGKIWLFLGSITYEMLLLHIPCRYLINYAYSIFPYNRNLWILAYIFLTILLSYLLKVVIDRIRLSKRIPA